MVHKVDPVEDGTLTAAHIHTGAAGQTGGPIVFLAHNVSDFGENIVQQLTAAQYNAILNEPLYVNAHSTEYPDGLVKGQIR
jgi:hypothetical protein